MSRAANIGGGGSKICVRTTTHAIDTVRRTDATRHIVISDTVKFIALFDNCVLVHRGGWEVEQLKDFSRALKPLSQALSRRR